MANYSQNGGRNADRDDLTSWRPQDQPAQVSRGYGDEGDRDYRSWRDRNYRDDERHAERYGQGQSGYSAGRYGDERAGYEAERYGTHSHRGTGPHRGKGPVGYQRSDERLRELVCESLADDDQVDASQIEVTVINGEVTLIGWVDDRRAKRDAEDCAFSISGVHDVQNQLRVKDDRQSGKPSYTSTSSGRLEPETSQDKKPRA